MLTAITRAPSPALPDCQLSFIGRQVIDLGRAQEQHDAYAVLLGQLGARVLVLPAEAALPDSMFVEDPALVLEELAVIFPLGTPARRGEAHSIAAALRPFRKLAYIELPGTMEGGDILQIGRTLYVGLSQRSNAEGFRQLSALLAPLDYQVLGVPVTGCLHLKSAVTALDPTTLLANRSWFDPAPFSGFGWVDVDPAEPHAANALRVGEALIFPASFPRTRARIEARGFQVTPLDISELQKAESGLTCSALLFEA